MPETATFTMSIGKLLIHIGLGLAAVGLILSLAPGMLGWFGKLPGDIAIKGKDYTVFIPITSMIVVSVILILLINLFLRR